MTFEEFFIKKKIDLKQLMQSRPDLYDEFRLHYTQMGEKSFDHTKKYWFNKLRKEYLLEEEQAVVSKPTVVSNPVETKPDSAITATKPAGFKPRFKPGIAKPSVTPEQTKDTPAEETPKAAPKPAGFKPRFKPGVTATTKPTEEEKTISEDPINTAKPSPEQASPPNKPLGFKPRFKAGLIPATKPTEEEQQPESPEKKETTTNPTEGKTTPPPKPLGFKPRFKAGSTGQKKDKPGEKDD